MPKDPKTKKKIVPPAGGPNVVKKAPAPKGKKAPKLNGDGEEIVTVPVP
jgi:hypothetical protein